MLPHTMGERMQWRRSWCELLVAPPCCHALNMQHPFTHSTLHSAFNTMKQSPGCWLQTAGAAVTAVDNRHRTPMALAHVAGHEGCVQLLAGRGGRAAAGGSPPPPGPCKLDAEQSICLPHSNSLLVERLPSCWKKTSRLTSDSPTHLHANCSVRVVWCSPAAAAATPPPVKEPGRLAAAIGTGAAATAALPPAAAPGLTRQSPQPQPQPLGYGLRPMAPAAVQQPGKARSSPRSMIAPCCHGSAAEQLAGPLPVGLTHRASSTHAQALGQSVHFLTYFLICGQGLLPRLASVAF